MEVAVIAAMVAVGYLMNETQNKEVINKRPPNLRTNENFNNPGQKTTQAPRRTTTQAPRRTTTQAPRRTTTQAPKIKSVCLGERRTKQAPCPYPSNEDTLWQNNVEEGFITLLSGEVIQKDNFKHANMAPHFGSKLTQNVNVNSSQSILEKYTGSSKCINKKKECKPFFKPQKNLGGIGAEHFRDIGVNMEDRYICSQNKKCELPFEQVRVGTGLNQGFTSKPSGGFAQNNTRDFVMPKNVDELRTLNNPKVTYEGRVLPAKKIDKRGKHGKLYKNRPETFYKNSPDRYFKTIGAVIKETGRPEHIIKDTNRTKLNRSNIGIAGPTKASREEKRPGHYTDSKKNIFKHDPIRNIKNTITDLINNIMGDYGKDSINLPANERDVTGTRTHITNLSTTVKALITPIQDTIKKTKKDNFVGAARQVGNVGMQIPNKMTVYDPNNVAKTTIKETLLKESEYMNFNGPKKLIVYDPDDVAKTTIKETLEQVDTHLNLKGNNKSIVYDPNDIARITTKQTTVGKNKTGIVSGLSQGDGYKVSNYEAQTTLKQISTEKSNYSGNPTLNKGEGYLTTNVEAPNTNRQFTSDNDYTGVAGNYTGEHMSQENMCNARLNVNKEKIAKGRAPTQNNVKIMSGGDNVNINIRKNDCDRENKRGATGFKGHTIIPSKDICSVTELRNDKDMDDRLDPILLDSLKDNPYAKRILNLKL